MQFIRCIKPNDDRSPGIFDDEMVAKQLKAFSIPSYAEFMRTGYPTRITIADLNKIYGAYISLLPNFKQFYSNLLQSIGFCRLDFKFGEKMIFFRHSRSSLIEDLMQTDLHSIQAKISKLKKKLLIQAKWNRIFTIISFIRCTYQPL